MQVMVFTCNHGFVPTWRFQCIQLKIRGALVLRWSFGNGGFRVGVGFHALNMKLSVDGG